MIQNPVFEDALKADYGVDLECWVHEDWKHQISHRKFVRKSDAKECRITELRANGLTVMVELEIDGIKTSWKNYATAEEIAMSQMKG